jgi:hypothetical protein
MQANQFMEQVKQLLNLELQQIHLAAHLAMFAPNEPVRQKVLHIICEELSEAMFLNSVLCAYSDMCMPVSPGVPYPGTGPGVDVCPDTGMGPGVPCPGIGMGPGVPCPGPGVGPIPGILPPAGPAATLPPSIPIAPPGMAPGLSPDIYPGVPYAEKEKEKKE